VEWYLSGPPGLEQGFDLAARPEGEGALVLELELAGEGLAPRLAAGGTRVELTDGRGEVRLHYRDLYAQDADGVELGARMELEGRTLRLVVDDTAARYPIQVDPLVMNLQATLAPADAATGDRFGYRVSLDGDRLAVGAPYDDDRGTDSGSVYVFVRSGTTWSQQAKLTAADGAANDHFGFSVSLSGDSLVVGAPRDDTPYVDAGSVYAFRWDGAAWSQEAKLIAEVNPIGDWFGYSVSLIGNRVAIGAPGEGGMGSDAGAVYVFGRSSGGAWSQQALLYGSNVRAGDQFGSAVALTSYLVSDNTLLVGAPYDDFQATDSGAVYVFTRSSITGWSQRAILKASDRQAGDRFGTALDVYIHNAPPDVFARAVIGAPGDDDRGADSGSVYVFHAGDPWTQQAKLTTAAQSTGAGLGSAVSIAPNAIAAGGPFASTPGANAGSAYLFMSTAGGWDQTTVDIPGITAGMYAGHALALRGATLVVSGTMAGPSSAGRAWVWQIQGAANGTPCPGGYACVSGHCVDGVCCNNDCGGGATSDCQACSQSAGGAQNGWCSYLPSTAVCRAAAGVCDLAEYCTGSNPLCPVDVFRPVIHVCRAAVGECDLAENCTGSGAACPADGFRPSTHECRASAGVCDLTENCTGAGAACPANAFRPSTHECRASAGVCDLAESCTGSGAVCPADAFRPSTHECRASAGVCDVAESCTGSAAACPSDAFRPGSYECRASAGVCDAAERCTGAGPACPLDEFLPSSTECRTAAGVCDAAERCTGTGPACPVDAFLPSSTECRASAGVCDAAERCTGAGPACPVDAFLPSSTECRASAGVCDAAERCTGTAPACPVDAFLPSSTECRASAGECDVAERCTGTAPACPLDAFLPSSTECRASAGVCDAAERCTGAGPACPLDEFLSSSTECRTAAGVCDQAERCTGTAPACPADTFLPSSTECRPAACAAGVAVEAASCTGGGADCPPSGETSCGAYACVGNACATSCASRADCAPGYYCDGAGQCLAAADLGTVCAADAECFTELCVDGVCCDQTCEGPCEACDLAGHLGECSPVTGAPRGGRPACLGEDGDPCQGACDGEARDACAYPGAETACREASCTDGVATLAASCRGDGACPALETQACAPYACEGTACAGDCATDEDCALGMTCSAGVCVERRPQGEACTAAGQCQSGQCVDGVCCDASCAGQCEACDLAGRLGTCSPVEGAPRGGRSACAGSAPCQGACDGQARQACAYPGSEVECGAASCRDGVETAAATCDGAGGCPAGETRACGACGCGPDGVCLETCGGDLPAESGCGCGAGGAGGGWAEASLLLVGLGLASRRRRKADHGSRGVGGRP
jgi:hypothetical protein